MVLLFSLLSLRSSFTSIFCPSMAHKRSLHFDRRHCCLQCNRWTLSKYPQQQFLHPTSFSVLDSVGKTMLLKGTEESLTSAVCFGKDAQCTRTICCNRICGFDVGAECIWRGDATSRWSEIISSPHLSIAICHSNNNPKNLHWGYERTERIFRHLTARSGLRNKSHTGGARRDGCSSNDNRGGGSVGGGECRYQNGKEGNRADHDEE